MKIIGSGLCGLWLGQKLRERDVPSVTVLEKSGGVGGRMATRRTSTGKFDHGAQFYNLRPPMQPLHARWKNLGLVQFWFTNNGVERWVCPNGMTALAKDLAQDLDVRFGHKVIQLEALSPSWRIIFETQEAIECTTVVLTSPLPQALALLSSSGISFDHRLNEVVYSKALVVLFDGVGSSLPIKSARGCFEAVPGTVIFSLVDQGEKGLTKESSWSVTMSPAFSGELFEASEEEIISSVVKEIRKIDLEFKFEMAQVKKWRYSHSQTTHTEPFVKVAAGLYLAGDAFGGPSLNGAIVSANALAQALVHELRP